MTSPALSLGTKAAAEYVGVCLSSLYALVREKAIDFERKPHGRIRFTLAALDKFNRSYQVAAMPRIRGRRGPKATPARKAIQTSVHRRFELARIDAERGA